MGRRRKNIGKVLSEGKTALARALEEGKDVKGMVGYISIEDNNGETLGLFVKVKCLGLDTGEAGCGLHVKVAIVSGAGELTITPCRWLDSVAQINTHVEIRKRQLQALADYEEIIRKPHYHRDKATLLDAYVERHLTNGKEAGWQEHYQKQAEASQGKAEKPITKTYQFSQTALAELARVAVMVANDLDATQAPDDYSFKH